MPAGYSEGQKDTRTGTYLLLGTQFQEVHSYNLFLTALSFDSVTFQLFVLLAVPVKTRLACL